MNSAAAYLVKGFELRVEALEDLVETELEGTLRRSSRKTVGAQSLKQPAAPQALLVRLEGLLEARNEAGERKEAGEWVNRLKIG